MADGAQLGTDALRLARERWCAACADDVHEDDAYDGPDEFEAAQEMGQAIHDFLAAEQADAWVLRTALTEWADDQDEVAADYESHSPDRLDDAAEMRRQATVAREYAARWAE